MGRSHIGVKHHWTYPREEFVSLGAHCETGETDLFLFFFWLLLVAIFFFFWLLFVALETGVYTLGIPGGIGNGGRDEPMGQASLSRHWSTGSSVQNLWQHHIKNRWVPCFFF